MDAPIEISQPAALSLYGPLGPGEIRLVQILPGPSESVLKCPLKVSSLEDAKYTALSYTRGKAELPEYTTPENASEPDTFDIRVNETVFTVPQNLYHFMFEMRQIECDLSFWIDALSINQADLEEKGTQINEMGNIYRSADKVLVWLGRDNASTPGVRDMMTRIAAAVEPQADVNEDVYAPFLTSTIPMMKIR